jgi:hypothetical protein
LLPRVLTVLVLISAALSGSGVVSFASTTKLTHTSTVSSTWVITNSDSDSPLQTQIHNLFEALNHRDLNAIKSQISPTRIYVEISDKTGAYLTNSQTLAVLESFLRSHTSLSAKLEFDNTDGENGSASGTLTARRNSRIFTYRLNFGFTKNDRGIWMLTRISMR